jgi:RNA polymerase sigma-70 factor (ECF subfamily)
MSHVTSASAIRGRRSTDAGEKVHGGADRPVPPARRDDATLAIDAARGDPSAHTAIWDRYSPVVRRMLVRSLGPGDDVEDQVQEVFLRFYRNRSSLKDPSALRAFLLGIAFHAGCAELRARKARSWMLFTRHGALDHFRAPDPDPSARVAVPRLRAILERLDTRSRLGFVMHYVEGQRLVDVASTLDVSLATVKRQLSRTSKRVLASARADEELAGYIR